MVLVVTAFVSTLPVMTRVHAPPPGWLGLESAGAPTKADEPARKLVLTVLNVDIRALSEEPVPNG
jgi:hypothetical protein